MKYLLAILILCSTVSASVRNTGTTTRDSVCIYVTCLDSTGKPATCDSFYVRVIKSGANAVAFSDSGTLTMTGMDSISGKSEYYYHRAVADIDGTGDDGEYILAVVAKKTAGSGWGTPNSRIFEIQNKLIFDQMKVVSTSDTAVVFATSAASKPTMVIRSTNNSSGYGLYVSSKASDAVLFDALADATVYGFHAKSASTSLGAGGYFDGSAGGSGAIYSGQSGNVVLGGSTHTADFGSSATFNDANIYAFVNLVGTTQLRVDSTSNASWFKTTITATLYPDSMYNGRLLYMKYSTRTNPRLAGEVTRIVKYDSVGTNKADIFYVYPPFSQAPAVGDTLIMYPLYSTSPTMVKDTIGTISVNFANDTGWVTAKAWIKAVFDTIQVYDNAGRFQLVVQQILDTLQTYDNATRFQANVQELLDTLKTYDNAGRFQALVQEILDTLKLHDNWVAKEASVTKVRDSVSKLHFNGDSVVAIDPIRTVVLTTPAPTLKQIRDTLVRAADTARIHVNDSGHVLIDDQWTDAQRDSIVARVLAARDSLHLRPINTFLVTDSDDLRASIIAAMPNNEIWTAAQRDSIIARVLANRDTAHSIHLAVDTVRDTANADIALDRPQATAANLIKVIDSVNAILDTVQNGSSTLRSTGSGSGEVWTEAQRDSIIARVVKLRDSVQSILDTLQNLSSTLRLAGSDLDTVYQTVLCNDTIGGDFLLTLSDYRAQVKRKFGVEIGNTTWMTDSVLNQLVREAIVTVNPIMRGYKTTKVMVSHFDSSDYPLDSLVGIASVLWHKDDTARSIPYLAREKWATLTTQNTYGADDAYLERPQVYDYTDALISFFPVPTSEDTIQINGWSKIPNITVVSSVAQIPQKYRIAILKYVTFLVARAKQHPLIDTFLNEYKESLVFLAGQNVQVAR